MKKLMILLTILAILMIGVVSAESLYGIYEEDNQQIVAGTFGDSDIVHLRDNYYGIVYTDGDTDGQLQIIEVNSNYQIINTSVDTWEFDTTQGQYPSLLNFNNETGLSTVTYKDADEIKIRSFDLFSNGTINTRDSDTILAAHFDIANVDSFKISSTHFIVGGISSDIKERMQMRNYEISSAGTLTGESDYEYCVDNGDYGNYQQIGLVKYDSNCVLYYKEKTSGEGYYRALSCTDTGISGGSSTLPSCTIETTYGVNFESNEVAYVDASVDDDAGFIYVTYTETVNNYPVLSVRNGTNNAALDKLRITTDTASDTKVTTLSSNNVLVTYTNNSNTVYKTFSIGLDGSITEVYSEELLTSSSEAATGVMPGTGNRYISSYTGGSGDVLTFGTGLIPPPQPEDTQVTISDENTLGAFDMTNKTLTFYAYCTGDTTYQTNINSTTTEVPVDCNYTGFAIKVEYELSDVSYNYKRYYLRDLDDTYGQFDLDVYLVNPYTTDFVYNEIVIDDLVGGYTNPKMYFEKNINGETTQITAYDLDAQNSMLAILMNGEEYQVYIDADEISKSSLGTYRAPSAGDTYETTVFHLYDIIIKPNFQRLGDFVEYQVYSEDNQISYFAKTPDDNDASIINITITLYNGTPEDGTEIYTHSLGSGYDPDSLYSILSGGPLNYSTNINQTTSAKLLIFFSDDSQIRQTEYTTTLWKYDKVSLPLMEYVSASFMDWFILILLTIIALYATIQTANATSMGIIGLAAIFVLFGWFSLSSGVLAVAAMVALISWLTNRGQ